MTNPPTVLVNNVLLTIGGCASISDASGNLLFYTDGVTVKNAAHFTMANGTGLLGPNGGPHPSVLILKRPGSTNLYYIFTANSNTSGLNYSVVDMSLAAGQGSVTLKNIPLLNANAAPNCMRMISGTKHCNGTDFWIVTHDYAPNNSTNVFRSRLLSSTGISSVAVTSSVGILTNDPSGAIKISPNGKRLGFVSAFSIFSNVHLMDFNNTTGQVTNPINLAVNGYFGCEFSPNSSKLYYASTNGANAIWQYDLCTAQTTSFGINPNHACGQIQLAKDGKVYVAHPNLAALSRFNNPDLAGLASNFQNDIQSLSPGTSFLGLPNFMGSDFSPPPAPPAFTLTTGNNLLGCQTASFTAPALAQNFTIVGCAPNGYSITNLVWNFGDPNSGATNTSTLANPIHIYSAPGTFTASLILYYSCGGGTDTLQQVVNVPPCVSIASQSITCASLGSATVIPANGTGPLSYTWLPVVQNGSVATGLMPGTHTVNFFDPANNSFFTHTVNFTSLIPLTGSLAHSPSITCNAAPTGTAIFTNLAGGSGTEIYQWSNGALSFSSNAEFISTLTGGQWSVTVTDALTACQIFSVFTITQPPALTLNIASSSPSTCLGTSINFTASNSGGTGAYTYTWVGGPSSDTFVVSEAIASNYVYTVNSSDANNCVVSETIAVDFVPKPTLTVADVSICPLEVGTLTVSGAASYTWHTSTPLSVTTPVFTDSPVSSTQYTVIGEALSCTAAATASIIVKPTPNPFISHNSPVCENSNLIFSVSGVTSAVWSGPSAFSSASINNTLSSVQLNQSGLYSATVTAANSCTASASASLTVKPLPQFSIAPSSSSICANTTSVTLSSSTSSLFSASSYTWLPNSGLSANSGTLVNAYPSSTTIYTVIASLNSCTFSAQTTVNVVPPPSLSAQLSSNTLCSQAFNGSPNTITLSAGGANTYSLITVPDMFNANPAGPVSPLTAIPPYTGIGSATLSGSNGVCTVSTSLTFSILPNPNISVNNYTPVICAGETFTYTNQGASTYTWSSATPGSTLYSNGGVAVASPTINSVFSVFGGSLGCNSALHTTTITVNPLPTVQVSPDPLLLCLGNTAELLAQSNGNSFLWKPPFGLNSYTTPLVTTHINQNQNYTVIATLNNCSNTAVAMVSIMPLPNAQIIPVKTEVCLFEQIQLKAEGGVWYEWKDPVLQLHNTQNLNLVASHLALSGTYTLKVTDLNSCVNYSSYPVLVHNLPGGYLVPERSEFCVPYCNSFTFVPNAQSSITNSGPWSLNNSIYSGTSFTTCFSKAETYLISGPIEDNFGCRNAVQLYVVGRPKPVASFYVTPENPVEGLDEVRFVNVTSNIVAYSWQSAGSSSTPLGMTPSTVNSWQDYKSEESSPSYVFQEAGIYGLMLIVKNEFNCWDTLMQSIEVKSDFAAYVPNAFTPNGDGLNDTFYPVLRGVKKFELQIFDRWGELIFSSNSSEHVWDGTFKGQECKQDVYNYKLVLLNVKGEEKMYSGGVMLYR